MSHIRPLALSAIFHEDKILVHEAYDSIKQEHFYRPLGGGIEFGETASHALIRELREEIGVDIHNTHYLGTLENIFTFEGKPGHEIILIFSADLKNPSLYQNKTFSSSEEHNAEHPPFIARWMPLEDFSKTGKTLYPNGLYDLISRHCNKQ